MAFIANTADDTNEMLAAIGVKSVDDLFSDIPEAVRLTHLVGPDRPLSEYESLRLMRERAALNHPAATEYRSFLGAGAYEHFIPAAVQAIAQRGEILTAYTPYQAEASQGTLQIVYEFQSMICAITGMEAANASMYDGASAVAEAVLMAARITGRNQAVLPATLHPAYRAVIESYTAPLGIELIDWAANPAAGGALLDPESWPSAANEPAALVIQQPNFFGYLEDARALAESAKSRGAVVIAAANPMSLSVIEPPGAWGADIAAGETQPMGLPLNFGGPYAGYLATKTEHLRKMPGRIVGKTVDGQGREGFVLTLQTREQHIRRERATSNICTNQGLCATMVTLWMALVGKTGFQQLGELNLDRAHRLHEGMTKLPGVSALCGAPFFNEFTVRLPISAASFADRMRARGVLAGLPAASLAAVDPRLLIICATETKTDDDLAKYLEAAEQALAEQSPRN